MTFQPLKRPIPLNRAFYERGPKRVARELLGKVLIREGTPGDAASRLMGRVMGRIVEVEAYLGVTDPASHAAAGKTARTSVMFGLPGFAYIYFIYGNHYCLNVSCEPEGRAGAVLFRALEPLAGIDIMARARNIDLPPAADRSTRDLVKLTSGPGRMAQAFGVTRARDNGCDLTSTESSLWIGEDGFAVRGIDLTPRIGISKAVDARLRYSLRGNVFVSNPRLLPIRKNRQ